MNDNSNLLQNEQLTKVGTRLRDAREAKGISIEEVASSSRINRVYIEQIENGMLNTQLGAVVVRGFVRIYIKFLGLGEELEAELSLVTAGDAKEENQFQVARRMDYLVVSEKKLFTPLRLVIALFLLAVVSGSVVTYQLLDSSEQQVVEEAVEEVVEEPEAVAVEEIPESPAPIGEIANSISDLSILKVSVRGLEPTWIRVSVDRAEPQEFYVTQDEVLNWDCEEEIVFTIGNSSGLSILMNGEEIVIPPGPKQLITDMTLNRLTLFRLQN